MGRAFHSAHAPMGAAINGSIGAAVGLLRGVAYVAFYGCSVAFVLLFLVTVSAAVASGFVVAGAGFNVCLVGVPVVA